MSVIRGGPAARASLNAGDMRRLLAQNNATWSVIQGLKDTDLVPQHSLGGGKAGALLASQAPKVDLTKILSTIPNNPFLQERLVERKLITAPNVDTSKLANLLLSRPISADLTALKSQGQILRAPSGGLPSSSKVTATARPNASTLSAAAVTTTAGVTGGTAPVMLDWTNRWGLDWITGVRDQDGCEACWAFASTALIEAMVRVNHFVWSIRSEGDVHDGMGAKCADGGNDQATMDWIQNNGLADPACFAWTTADVAYTPTSDRSGRTVKIDNYTWLGSTDDQKTWLDTTGPIMTWFDVWADFDSYGGGVYHKQANLPNGQANYERGGHFMLVVGYDDSPGQNCWIVKNSWGTGWGQGGFGRIGYGETGIDQYSKIGVTLTNPDPWTKRRLHSGNMIESGDGAMHRNFEMVATGPSSQVVHWWRDNSVAGFPWSQAETFGSNDAAVCPTFTGTTYNRNFELVYLTTSGRLHHWFFDQSGGNWADGGVFGPPNAAGVPGFIQGNYGAPGNFEVVVRLSDGTLNHWWRQNGPPWTWSDGAHFASNVAFSGASLVQSNYGNVGNLELVCVLTNGQMQHWWRNNDASGLPWSPSVTFGSNVASPPCMIQGEYGAGNEYAVGNFELCVAVGGSIQHWWRDNASGSMQWNQSATFGSNVQAVAALIEGSYGFNLEVIALTYDNHLQHYWRDGSGNWNTGVVIGSA